MRVISLGDLQTIVVGLTALQVATLLAKWIPGVGKSNIPTPVIGGVLGSLVVALTRRLFDVELQFATTLTDLMLLIFFTSVGLSAKLSALKAGGKPLVIVCAATVLLIVAQNVTGVLVALGFGAHPFYGLLVGSISFVGGPGTAAAWAKEAANQGLTAAPEVAVAGATMAVVVGAIVAGPVTGWLVARKKLQAKGGASGVSWVANEAAPAEAAPAAGSPGAAAAAKPAASISIEKSMSAFLLILVSVLIGQTLNEWSKKAGMILPGFLTAMLAGVAITNVADLVGWKLDFDPIERDGELALKTFLVMFLMGLKLWTLGAAIGPLAVNVVVQVVISTAIAVLLLFRWLGRDYDAAVAVGGFLGFGLSSMAVGMASMDKVASRYGPAPKAFLLITLAGSFFVDLSNAFVVQAMLKLPLFHHQL
jgi:ESS family glutamate:Na+ symporter